jgi:hypothetical protein
MFINGRKLSLEYVVLVPVEALMRAEVRDVLYLLTWCNSSAAAFKDLLDAVSAKSINEFVRWY